MDKIFDHPSRDDQSVIAMEAMMENYPNDNLKRVISLPNAQFSDPNKVPSGIVTIHPLTAVVHPDSVPNEMFESLLVCQIQDPQHKLDDAFFKGKEKLLQSEIPQYASNPPRLVGMISKETGKDLDAWTPEIGRNGFVGIFKKISEENKRHHDYFIVAQSGAEVAAREYKQNVLFKEKTQFKDLMLNPAFNFTKNIARRNAERLVYCTSKLLGVEIRKVPDVSAFTGKSYIAQPFRAAPLPGFTQSVSSIEAISWEGNSYAAVFHKVRSNKTTQEHCFVNAGPYNGIAIFNMRGRTAGIGLPVDTGVKTSRVNISNIKESEMEERARGFVWEGQENDNYYHDALLPGKFHNVDNKFLKEMKKLGWQQTGVDNRTMLIPVIVKLGNPELKRK